jgi:hypothetical protein
MLDDDAYLRWSRSRDSPILLAPSLSIFPRPPARRVANSPLRVYENRNAVLASLADYGSRHCCWRTTESAHRQQSFTGESFVSNGEE